MSVGDRLLSGSVIWSACEICAARVRFVFFIWLWRALPFRALHFLTAFRFFRPRFFSRIFLQLFVARKCFQFCLCILLIIYDFSNLIHYLLFNIQIRKNINLDTKKIYYSSLKKINKVAAIDCVQLDVIDQLSSEFGLGTLLGQMPDGDYDNCWNFHCHVLTTKTELTFPKVTMKQVNCQSKLYCQVISVEEKKKELLIYYLDRILKVEKNRNQRKFAAYRLATQM